MRDEDDLSEPELGDDGVKVTDLIVGGVRVAGRLIRTVRWTPNVGQPGPLLKV
jgi:hypothetical protein